MTEAIKLDAGKPRITSGVLWRFPRALAAIAEVSAVGCRKYGLPLDDTSFMTVLDGFLRYSDALGRHLRDEKLLGPWNVETGGQLPPEGVKVRRAAQTAWNALARLEIALRDEEQANAKGRQVSADKALGDDLEKPWKGAGEGGIPIQGPPPSRRWTVRDATDQGQGRTPEAQYPSRVEAQGLRLPGENPLLDRRANADDPGDCPF